MGRTVSIVWVLLQLPIAAMAASISLPLPIYLEDFNAVGHCSSGEFAWDFPLFHFFHNSSPVTRREAK